MKKILLLITTAVLLGGGFYGYSKYCDHVEKVRLEQRLQEAKAHAWQELQQDIRSEIAQFKGESGIVIKDLKTEWEFSHEENKPFASASLAKVPVMAACYLAVNQEKIKLEDNIALKNSDKLTGFGTLKGMDAGSVFSVQTLIELMITESDNTATHMVTNLLGLNYLNTAFEHFGLNATRLSRKIADYKMRDKGYENYTTAADMAMLFEKMYRGRIVNPSHSENCMNVLKQNRMKDRIPKLLPVDTVVAHKTGLENGICHDAGIIFTPQGDLMIIALTRHENSNSVPSKEFISKIALHTYNYSEKIKQIEAEFKKL